MVIGLAYTIKIMEELYDVVHDPNSMKAMIDQGIQAVGKDTIVIKQEEVHVEGTKVLVIAIFGGIAFLLAWLSLGIILAGARVVSITTSDKEAIKKILKGTSGRSDHRIEKGSENSKRV